MIYIYAFCAITGAALVLGAAFALLRAALLAQIAIEAFPLLEDEE